MTVIISRQKLIDEAIKKAVAEERERCAKMADDIAKECTQDHTVVEFCEEFGCSSFRDLAAAIRKGVKP